MAFRSHWALRQSFARPAKGTKKGGGKEKAVLSPETTWCRFRSASWSAEPLLA